VESVPALDPSSENLLALIEAQRPTLSPTGRRVAERTLSDPSSVASTSLADFSVECSVSEPSVIRFCRSVGCDGFRDFKLRVAASLATQFQYADIALGPGSTAAEYAAKAVDASLDALLRLRGELDPDEIEQAVTMLAEANRIEFYGVGASGVVALDAQHKFFRFSTPTTAHRDAHMQRMAAAALAPGDVLVAFSHTGRTRALISALEIAHRSGASTLAVTAHGSPLSRVCDHVVSLPATEDTDAFTPMVSRLTHLVVVDVLALGVALRGGEATSKRLQRIKEVLGSERLAPETTSERERAAPARATTPSETSS
jgi:RpiR family carbohydrate utilization transcriptional regulator